MQAADRHTEIINGKNKKKKYKIFFRSFILSSLN